MQNFTMPYSDGDKVNLSEDDQNLLVTSAVKEWMMYTDLIKEKLEQSSENWQAYIENKPAEHGIVEPDDIESSHASVRTGLLPASIDGMHAQLCLAAYPAGTQFSDPKPRNQLSKRNKQNYERLCQQSAQKLNQLIYAYQDIKQEILDGTSAVWHPWVRIERKRPVYMAGGGLVDPNDPNIDELDELLQGEVTKTYRDTVEAEGTGFYPLALDDWRCDPTVDDIDDTPFIWRRWVYPEDIKDTEGFINGEDVLPYRNMLFDDTYQIEKLEYQGIDGTHKFLSHMMGDGEDEGMYPNGMACLFERWGDFFINGKLYRNHVLVYSNDRTFHWFGPNPYDHQEKPFSISPFIPIPGSLYGKTSITDAIPMMHAVDTLVNQALDIINVTANAPNLYNPSDAALQAYIQKHQTIRPGAFIPSSNPAGVLPLRGDYTGLQLIDRVVAQFGEFMRNVTGGVPYATGGVTEGDQRTLGEVEILASATNSRFQATLQTYERYRLQRFAMQEFENYRQYMSEPVEVTEEGKTITPNVMKLLDFDFEITGSRTVLNKSRSLQDMRDALAIVPSVVQSGVAQLKQSNKTINPIHIVEEIFSTLGVSLEQVFEEVDMQATLGGQDGIQPVSGPAAGPAQGGMGAPQGAAGLPPVM